MYKFFICVVLYSTLLFAAPSEIPDAIRNSYASNFYQAFQMQCHGKSTSASAQFWSAHAEAQKAGENSSKLALMEQLFVWYRTYGTSCYLFAEVPVGWDQINGEYKNPYQPYKSEWGKTPEQAALIRTFMLGVGELISGVFCVIIGSIPIKAVGVSLCTDGFHRMYDSLNGAYALHERALLDLKQCEETASKIKGMR